MVSLLIFALTAFAGAPDGPSRYLPTQSEASVDALLAAAVEKSVQGVPWAFRGIARPRLQPLATTCPAYNFVLEPGWFSVQCDGKPLVRRQVGTTTPWVDPKGKTLMATVSERGNGFVLDFKGDDGGKKFTYIFAADGALAVTQEVYSHNLAVPMVWTLQYRAN